MIRAPRRPVLRYFGGKFRLRHWVVSHFPPHHIYCEPYGGAASCLLAKARSPVEIYNDLDGAVVSLFRILRDPQRGAELIRQLKLTPFARQEFEEAYEQTRDPMEQARRLIIRSYMGHGSDGATRYRMTGFRNKMRSDRGTTAASEWATYPEHLQAITERLQAVCIENKPALEIISMYDRPETLFYCDPPYLHHTRGKRWHSYQHEMSEEDHDKLAKVLRPCKGMVVLSGYPSDLYPSLYPDWACVKTESLADGARRRTECLWLSPHTVAHLRQRTLPFAEAPWCDRNK